MNSASILVLHGGIGEVTLLLYLFRVVLYLVAFGVLAAVVFYGMEAVHAVRSRVVEASIGREDASVDREEASVGRESEP